MNTENNELNTVKTSSTAGSFIAGVFMGALVGAVTSLLFAPQPGERTRAELQQGVGQLRDRTTESVRETVTNVKSRAGQIKADVQIKAGELQEQGKKLVVKQLDHVTELATAGKKAIENLPEHKVA